MAIRLTNPFSRYFTDNAALLSGGRLNFFEDDGGTTPKNTFTTNALSVANANPVILSSSGVMPDIFLDGAYRVTLENSAGVQLDEADNVNAGDDEATPFAIWDSSITYDSGNSVIVTGSDGKYYRSTTASNLNNDPTISPGDWDRVFLISDTDPTMNGPLDSNSFQVQWSKGADVASATALPVLTDGNSFDVTGTTTITSIATTKIGTVIKLHFDGILILTHNATDLVLPGAANITTAAGDEAEFVEYASGDYRCTNYSRASGEAIVPGSWVEIEKQTPASVGTVDFITGIDSSFDVYFFVLANLIPATDGANLLGRTSTDGGSVFDNGSGNYGYGIDFAIGATPTSLTSISSTSMSITAGVGSSANENGVSGILTLVRPSEATHTQVEFSGGFVDTSARQTPITSTGARLSAADVDAFRFLFSSGDVESGIITLYGVKNT